MNLQATEKPQVFYDGTLRIQVNVENSLRGLFWQMQVGEGPDSWSPVCSHYSGLLVHKGYAIATAYLSPDIKEFVPFKLQYAQPA